MSSSLSPARILAAIFILPRISTLAAKCFLPDGNRDINDLPCFTNDTLSRCCAPDEVCSTNKLCVKSGGLKFVRGSCLDKEFGTECPDFCKGIKDSGKVEVFQCGDPTLGHFCCDQGKGSGGGSSCCSTPTNIITLGVVSTFLEGATQSFVMSSMANPPIPLITLTSFPPTTIQTPRSTSPRLVTSIIISSSFKSQATSPILLSVLPATSAKAQSQSLNSFITLASSFLGRSSSALPLPTTLLSRSFTDIPSPVFTSIFVPTSTPTPRKTITSPIASTSSTLIPLLSTTSLSTSSTTTSRVTAASAQSGATTSNATSVPANAPLLPSTKRLNTNAIIAGVVGGAIGLFIITFFLLLFRHQQKKRGLGRNDFATAPGKYSNDEKGSIRSVRSDSSVRTAFGYKPQPKMAMPVRNNSATSDESEAGGGNFSVPIVFRSETPWSVESVRSADIKSIEERLQRLSGTTYRSLRPSERDRRRMTPGSDFNVYQPTTMMSPTGMGAERDSYIDEREMTTFGLTPEDLNRVGGTGYGQGITGVVVPMEISGMEKRIPENARISNLSERSTTYRKLLFDVQSQPF